MNSLDIAVQNDCVAERTSSVCRIDPKPVTHESPHGVKKYPQIKFTKEQTEKLADKVQEILKKPGGTKPGGSWGYLFLKRTIDIIGSGLGLIVLSIPMLLTARKIRKEDGGPAIFKQVRMTANGRPFTMYKFRSMYIDAEERFAEVQAKNETDGIAFKMEDDPRITPIGKKIRTNSMDELPQLWNVFKGDMSLIGPRPPLPREVYMYDEHQMERLRVKGGLSCFCQCNGRSDMPFDEWVESDITYIKNRSTLLDIKLMIKTVRVVLQKKGAR